MIFVCHHFKDDNNIIIYKCVNNCVDEIWQDKWNKDEFLIRFQIEETMNKVFLTSRIYKEKRANN